jgi:hypothetical protein
MALAKMQISTGDSSFNSLFFHHEIKYGYDSTHYIPQAYSSLSALTEAGINLSRLNEAITQMTLYPQCGPIKWSDTFSRHNKLLKPSVGII